MYPAIVKDKAKYKPVNTGFCNYVFCMKQVQLKDDNTCMRCGSPVAANNITHKATMEKFDKILEKITPAINNHIFSEFEKNGLKIPVQIGTGSKEYFFIPLRYFIEYQNFKHSDDYQQDKKSIIEFIEYVKSKSEKVKL